MNGIELTWHLIPDGASTIVEFALKGEFYVNSANAPAEADEVIVRLVSRLSGEPEQQIREQMAQGQWVGEGWRPEEPEWPHEP